MKTFYLIVVLGFLVGFNCNCGTNYTECSIAAQYYCCPGTTCPSTSASCIQPCSNVMCSDGTVQWCCNSGFECDYTFLDHVCNQDCFNAGGNYCGNFGCCFNNTECQSDGSCQATSSTFSKYSITFQQINWLYLYWQTTDGSKLKVCLSGSSSEVNQNKTISNFYQNENCIAAFSNMDQSTNYFKYFGKISDSYTNPTLTFHCDNMIESCDFKYVVQTGEYNKLWGPDMEQQ